MNKDRGGTIPHTREILANKFILRRVESKLDRLLGLLEGVAQVEARSIIGTDAKRCVNRRSKR